MARLNAEAGAPYIEGGFQTSMWLRLSDPDLKADLLVGPWAGVGGTITDHVGIGLRSTIEVPLFHTLFDTSPGNIVGSQLIVYWNWEGRDRRRPEAPADPPQPAPTNAPGNETIGPTR